MRLSVQNDIFLHNATQDFCNTISCQALGNAHFPVLKNSPIVFWPEDYLCAQTDIRERFLPKYMESFRHADSPELQEVLSVSRFLQHIYHSLRQTILTFQVLCFYISPENQTTTLDQYIEISAVHNRIAASWADSRSVL